MPNKVSIIVIWNTDLSKQSYLGANFGGRVQTAFPNVKMHLANNLLRGLLPAITQEGGQRGGLIGVDHRQDFIVGL